MAKFDLPKTYDFASIEGPLYDWWEAQGYFRPENDPQQPRFDPSERPFVISMPPPNVTGELHLGHGMVVSLEDLMVRQQRMRGAPALWVPGTDHAGIATQLQVERELNREGFTREQVGRDEFLRRAWAWREKYGGRIIHQLRRLGASADWSREHFTLDPGFSRAVREAFVRLYEEGLIYRGPRMINWSPLLRTAVSDLEVEYSEEPGTLYYFKYRLADDPDQFIPVATTRPETILGDTAVAVHPEDDRYAQFVGRQVLVPILDRPIPVIADSYVDREFGTGALKVTPAHDFNDYAIAERHQLPAINILDEEAHINDSGGPYAGLDRYECRRKIWEDMRRQDLVIKEEAYTINVPRSERGGEVVEPMISTQWFVRMAPLAEPALEAVRQGRIEIVPERFTKVYTNWLENIQDWCISRQLWWGHRIPVWYCDDCGAMTVERQDPTRCSACGSSHIHQDPDVLDTWFSSALWPFATLGWPDQTPDLQYFYPTSVLETGYDILFFWVARMIMFGLKFTGQVPFRVVYLHGLVRDEHGQKMSKTKGNVIDPLVLMDQMGTDALRFTLLVGSTPGNDVNLSVKKVEANRNFANKVWNAGRFVMSALEDLPAQPQQPPQWTLADRWIWARLQGLLRDVDRLFAHFQYGEAGSQIYNFFWSDFADWYIEVAKLQLAEGGDRRFYTAQRLVRVLDTVLRLLHPYTPFVTEALWDRLRDACTATSSSLAPEAGWEDALMIARWPAPLAEEPSEREDVAQFEALQEVVRSIRNARTENKVPTREKIDAVLVADRFYDVIQGQIRVIANMAQLEENGIRLERVLGNPPSGYTALVTKPAEIYLPLSGFADAGAERGKLESDLLQAEAQIERLEKLLASEFSQKAPPAVVAKERAHLAEFQETASKIQDQLERLSSTGSARRSL